MRTNQRHPVGSTLARFQLRLFTRHVRPCAREPFNMLVSLAPKIEHALAAKKREVPAHSGPNSTLTESTEFLPMLLAVQDCCLQGSQVECF